MPPSSFLWKRPDTWDNPWPLFFFHLLHLTVTKSCWLWFQDISRTRSFLPHGYHPEFITINFHLDYWDSLLIDLPLGFWNLFSPSSPVKHKSQPVISHFKIFQWLPVSLSEKAKILTRAYVLLYDLSPYGRQKVGPIIFLPGVLASVWSSSLSVGGIHNWLQTIRRWQSDEYHPCDDVTAMTWM
jgi:hypothetical protein